MAHEPAAGSRRPTPDTAPADDGMGRSATGRSPLPATLRQGLVWLLGLGLLALVFALYAHPTLRVTLAEMVWACFN